MCVSIPIQGWHLSTETWPSEVGSLQDGIRAHVDCRTWPLETGKPIGKIFSKNSFSKDLLLLFSYELIQKFLFSETIPFSSFYHSTDEATPRSTRYRTTETIRNEEYFPCIWISETTMVEDRRQVEFEGSEEFPDLYDLGRLPLWNLTDYGSCQCPRSRCVGERLEHGA